MQNSRQPRASDARVAAAVAASAGHRLLVTERPGASRAALVKLHALWAGLSAMAVVLSIWAGTPSSIAWYAWMIVILPALAGLWLGGSARPQSGVGLLAGAWVMLGSLGVAATGGIASPLAGLLLLAPLSVICLGRRDSAVEVAAFAVIGFVLAILSVELELMPRGNETLGTLPLFLTLAGVLQAGAYAGVAGGNNGQGRARREAPVRARQAAMMEGAPGEFTLDAGGRVRQSTHAGASRLGVQADELGQVTLLGLVDAIGRQSVQAALARPGAGFARCGLTRRSAQVADFEFGPIAPDGGRKVHVTLFPAASVAPGAPGAALAPAPTQMAIDAAGSAAGTETGRDAALHAHSEEVARLTSRAETAEAALANRSLFFAQMTHEFRTPLGAIQGFAEMIERGMFGPLSDRYRDYAQLIRHGSRSMQILVDDVLDLSRVEAGRYEAHLEPIDAQAICSDVARFMQEIAAQARVQIVVDAAAGVSEVVADRYALRQVLINLVSNAIKAMPDGGEVALRLEERNAGSVRLSVGDTGEGMTAEELVRVTRAFEQAGRMDKRLIGYGLGLSVVQRMCSVMHARFSIDSTPGLGTMASLDLPAAPVDEVPTAARPVIGP